MGTPSAGGFGVVVLVFEPDPPQPAIRRPAAAARAKMDFRTTPALRVNAVAVTGARLIDGECAQRPQDLRSQASAVGGVGGRRDYPRHDLVTVDLLDPDVRRVAGWNAELVREQLLHPGGGRVGVEASQEVHAFGFAQRDHREGQQHAVGHHDPVGAVDKGRIEEPEGADDPLHASRHGAAAKAHALAAAEGPGREEHHPGKEVSDRLLRSKTENHRCDRAADGKRVSVEPGDPQGDDDHRRDREQPYEEPGGSGGGGIHPAHEHRRDPTPQRTCKPPSQDNQGDDGRDSRLGAQPGKSVLRWAKATRTPATISANSTKLPRARDASARSTSAPRPTWRHCSVLLSKNARPRRGEIGIRYRLPGQAKPERRITRWATTHRASGSPAAWRLPRSASSSPSPGTGPTSPWTASTQA